ncbi:DUF1353 domain-containing protein, partial [Pseudomonas sp.]|uniref:DUF1353 domain-containing protein n=1 Tax=Pseudomonas sp. TaxID=306 RepID=UPI00258DF569
MIAPAFLDNLTLIAYAAGEWAMGGRMRYRDSNGVVHEAPQYFVTDLASTPWIAKPLLGGIDDRRPGAMHDALYCQNILPREICDALLYEMLIVSGADKARAWLMYSAVRMFGGPRYAACAGGMRVEDLAFELMGEP